jgi:protein-S-isoprenylcysteine O-methyltransferase Ste14
MSRDVTRRRIVATAGTSLFLVLAPGIVAGLIPWWLTGWTTGDPLPYSAPLRVFGAGMLLAGAGALLHAFARFVTEGLGTPAPAAPTERLVVGGLYRYVRNPMYLAVAAVIVGQALLLSQPRLLLYAAAINLLTAAFVRWYEEPTLSRQFGADYEAYRRAVPAWLPRRRPWRGESLDRASRPSGPPGDGVARQQGRSLPMGRTTSTGHGEDRSTSMATLPRAARARPLRP